MRTDRLLTIDTSTLTGSVAVSQGERLLGEIVLNVRSTHSERLLHTLHQLLMDVGLSLEDMDAFGVVVGPGSFTGLRIGMATVKGLALACGKPVVGVSSLETLAMGAPYASLPVCALLDARKKEVYAGLYQWEKGFPRALGPERVLPPEALLQSLTGEVLFIGDGADVYRSLIVAQMGGRAHFSPWPGHLPRASQAAGLALRRLHEGEGLSPEGLLPQYLRPSDAEIMWQRRQEAGAVEG